MKHEPQQQVEPVPIHTMPETAVEGKPSVSRKPILLEEDATEKKDKIDSKNLVIYYEIMKQKF